jgi:hypothetical protein
MKKRRESFCEEGVENVDLIVESKARGLEKRILKAMELPFTGTSEALKQYTKPSAVL